MMRSSVQRIWHYLFPIAFIGICFILSGCGKVTNTLNNVQSFWSNSIEDCWPCAIYGSSFEILSKIVMNALPVIYVGAKLMLTIGAFFFILAKAGKLFWDPDANYRKVMKESAYAFFKAFAVGILFLDPKFFNEIFISMILEPVGNSFLGLADVMLSSGPRTNTSIELQSFTQAQTTTLWTTAGEITLGSDIFGNLPYQVQFLVFRIYRALRMGVGAGIYIMNHCDRWDILGMVAALFMIFYSFELTLIIPCIFVDSFMRLGVVALILPFLLVCWVFEGTSKLLPQLKSAIPLVLSAFLDIVFACMFIVVMATTLQVYSDAALDQAWAKGATGNNLAFVTQAKFFSHNFLILLILVVAFRRLAEHISDISSIYGGGGDTSGWALLKKVKDAAKGLGKTTAGLVSLNIGMVGKGLKQTAEAVARRE